VTARELIRRSSPNWFRPDYPYVYASAPTSATSTMTKPRAAAGGHSGRGHPRQRHGGGVDLDRKLPQVHDRIAQLGAAAGSELRQQWIATDTGFALSPFQSERG
jgi:hypothetical protein